MAVFLNVLLSACKNKYLSYFYFYSFTNASVYLWKLGHTHQLSGFCTQGSLLAKFKDNIGCRGQLHAKQIPNLLFCCSRPSYKN